MSASLPELRRLIDHLLLSAPDLDGFLQDYFPAVFQQVSSGMQRAAKVTLLFTYVPNANEILAALNDRFPGRTAAPGTAPIAGTSPPSPETPNSATQTPDRQSLPASLRTALRTNRIIPFVGAGVSMAVLDRHRQVNGKPARLFPSWRELLERAAERLKAENAPGEAQLVQGALGKRIPDYLLAAQTAQDGLGPLWYPFLRENFNPSYERVVSESLALGQALWRLGSRFLITTNYDRVLRWACPPSMRENLRELGNQAAAEQMELLRNGPEGPTIWYLHGSIDDTRHIILTPDGYSRLYPDRQQGMVTYQSALQTLRTLFSTHSLLFIGFSFTDPQFGDQLRWIQEVFAGATGPHYLLVRQEEKEAMQARLTNVRLELVSYVDHGQPLLELLALMAREATTSS